MRDSNSLRFSRRLENQRTCEPARIWRPTTLSQLRASIYSGVNSDQLTVKKISRVGLLGLVGIAKAGGALEKRRDDEEPDPFDFHLLPQCVSSA